MPPLSIVHTENSCGWGGQEIRILTEARGFLDRGHRVRYEREVSGYWTANASICP